MTGKDWLLIVLLVFFWGLFFAGASHDEDNFSHITFRDLGIQSEATPGTIFYTDGHFYGVDGKNHVFSTASGVKTTTTTITNTAALREVYRYEFLPDEIHVDEHIKFSLYGFVNTAAASDTFNVSFWVDNTQVHEIVYDGGNVDNVGLEINYIGTVRTSGENGTFVEFAKMVVGTNVYSAAELGVHIINTTKPIIFNVTVKWNNAKANNIFSVSQGILEFYH